MSAARSTAVNVLLAALALAASASAQEPPAAPPAPAFETDVITSEPIHAVVLPMKGSYLQHQDAFARLQAFLSGRGVTPTGEPFGRYFSDPSVGEANLVWEVGSPVAADVKAEAPFEIRDLPATLVAVHVHTGPIEGLGPAWGDLIGWIMSNGYQPAGPAMQVFTGYLAGSPAVEMSMPVSKPVSK